MKQKEILQMIKSIAGQANVLTIPRVFIKITGGDVESALLLSQAIYWSDKTGQDGWFYKSYREWEEELSLTRRKVDKARRKLDGIIETKVMRANGSPTVHYRVNFDVLIEKIASVFTSEPAQEEPICTESTDGFVQNVQMDLYETSKSICTKRTNGFVRNEQNINIDYYIDYNIDYGTDSLAPSSPGGLDGVAEPQPAQPEPRKSENPKPAKPIPEKKKSTKPKDNRTNHPAIQTYRRITGRYPPKALYDNLIAALGELPDEIRLEDCYKEWVKRGYNPNAATWALEWYRTGIPTRLNKAEARQREELRMIRNIAQRLDPDDPFAQVDDDTIDQFFRRNNL